MTNVKLLYVGAMFAPEDRAETLEIRVEVNDDDSERYDVWMRSTTDGQVTGGRAFLSYDKAVDLIADQGVPKPFAANLVSLSQYLQ